MYYECCCGYQIRLRESPVEQMTELNYDPPIIFVLQFASLGEGGVLHILLLLWVALLPLYLPLHECYDFFDIVFESVLQFLVVTPALVGCSFMQLFRESVEYNSFPSLFLRAEISGVFLQKLEVDFIFLESPTPVGHPAVLVVEMQLLIFVQIRVIELSFSLRTLTLDDFSTAPLLAAWLPIQQRIYRSFYDLPFHQQYIIQIIIHHPFKSNAEPSFPSQIPTTFHFFPKTYFVIQKITFFEHLSIFFSYSYTLQMQFYFLFESEDLAIISFWMADKMSWRKKPDKYFEKELSIIMLRYHSNFYCWLNSASHIFTIMI